jgi:hypothetical protein
MIDYACYSLKIELHVILRACGTREEYAIERGKIIGQVLYDKE